jgi:hypothetical protein
MSTTILKLSAGDTVLVSAIDPSLGIGGGPMPGGGAPVDPGYGIDLGLGIWGPTDPRPTPPIVLPPPVTPPTPPTDPVDPGYGIDIDVGYVRPEHPIVLPPTPPGKPPVQWELKTAWTPVTGWIVVAIPTGEHATPAKKR